MSNLSYHEQIDRENILKLRHLIKDLPPFCGDFFRGIEPRTSSRTRISHVRLGTVVDHTGQKARFPNSTLFYPHDLR